jgi:chromosome segregation ATPase
MSQKTQQAEKEAAELRRKLQTTKKDLQGSQHELEMTNRALERAREELGAARLEQERLQTQLYAAPESSLDPQDLKNAFAQVKKLTNNHEVSDRRDRYLKIDIKEPSIAFPLFTFAPCSVLLHGT